MNHRLMLTTGHRPAPGPRPVNEPGVPYPIPQARPYNVPEPAITPTPDGTGSALHPDVVDFGPAGWNGWRYWMAYTPYFNENSQVENPCLAVSQDGYHWQVPDGVTNPLDPTPPKGWNADTDMVYADGVLHLFWRDWDLTVGRMMMRTSTNGRDWTAKEVALTGTPGDNLTSHAAVYDGQTWHVWNQTINSPSGIVYRTAPSPTGPWTEPVPVTFTSATSFIPWHLDVILHEGRYWMVIYINRGTYPLRVASSVDGLTWAASEEVMHPATNGWDTQRLYRSTIQPMPKNDTHFRM